MSVDPDAEARKVALQLFPNMPSPEQVKEFFEAVGIAMSAWQLVEQALHLIFERSTVPARPGAAACAFHTLLFRSKLESADAAVRFALLSAEESKIPILTEEWAKLRKKTAKRNKARNNFAHFQTFTYYDEPTKLRRVRLQPVVFDFRYSAGLIKGLQYTLDDVRINAESFRRLAVKLQLFLMKIPPPKKPPA